MPRRPPDRSVLKDSQSVLRGLQYILTEWSIPLTINWTYLWSEQVTSHSYMPIFYKIASIKSGNCNVNNFLPVSHDKGRAVTSIHYVQSISHNVIKQDSPLLLMFVLPQEVWCELASQLMMRWVPWALQPITSFSSSSGVGGTWEIGQSENNLPRPSTTWRCNFHGREIPGTVMHQRQYLKTFLD